MRNMQNKIDFSIATSDQIESLRNFLDMEQKMINGLITKLKPKANSK